MPNQPTLLLKALRQGDSQLLAVLFEQYGQWCVRTLRRRTGCSEEESRDTLMDALLVVRRNVLEGKVDKLAAPRQYLYTICYNLYRHRRQQDKRRQQQQFEVLERWYDTPYDTSLADQSGHATYRTHLLRAAQTAMGRLGGQCQQLISYFYFDRLSLEEIAQRMGWGGAPVAKNNKYRCMKKLIQYTKELEQQRADS